jgi:hypothetical protein
MVEAIIAFLAGEPIEVIDCDGCGKLSLRACMVSA